MNSLQPVMTLLGQAERERDALAVDSQSATVAQRTASAQLDQLMSYRRDYEKRWAHQFRTDGRMELVNCYRGFMERLTHAVETQRHIAQQADGVLEQARLALRDAEVRVASVRKLIERRVAEVRIAGDRREQNACDEFAARATWNLHGTGDRAGAL